MALSTSHTYHEMDVHERQAFQEEETSKNDWGGVLMTIGAIFLLFDLFIGLFVGRDVVDGALFFVKWGLIQTVVGLVLIAVGLTLNRRAHTKDDA
jgi:uncharacterized membrane protein